MRNRAKARTLPDQPTVVVVALPRGSVPVVFEIVSFLHVPVNVFLVRNLGLTGRKNLRLAPDLIGGAAVRPNRFELERRRAAASPGVSD
jgi:predicted phosphoribosyltransferase